MIKLYCRTCNIIITSTPDNDEYYIMQSGRNLRYIMHHIHHDLEEVYYSETDGTETPYVGIDNMPDTDTVIENGLHLKIVNDANEIKNSEEVKDNVIGKYWNSLLYYEELIFNDGVELCGDDVLTVTVKNTSDDIESIKNIRFGMTIDLYTEE